MREKQTHPASTSKARVDRGRSRWPASLAASWLIAICVLCFAGCGNDGRLTTYPVSGQVMINGEPAAGCTVALVPLDPELKGEIMPGGLTEEDGSFQLTTYETHDGAPAGEYGVSLQWEASEWPGKEAESRMDPGPPVGPDRLMGQFSSPEKSGLQATIAEEPNQLEPFRLEDVRLLAGSK